MKSLFETLSGEHSLLLETYQLQVGRWDVTTRAFHFKWSVYFFPVLVVVVDWSVVKYFALGIFSRAFVLLITVRRFTVCSPWLMKKLITTMMIIRVKLNLVWKFVVEKEHWRRRMSTSSKIISLCPDFSNNPHFAVTVKISFGKCPFFSLLFGSSIWIQFAPCFIIFSSLRNSRQHFIPSHQKIYYVALITTGRLCISHLL